MDNYKISKELLKVAKKLVSDEQNFDFNLFKQCDLDPFVSEIKKYIGVSPDLNVRVVEKGEKSYLEFSSKNLAKDSGVFSNIVNKVFVVSFGGSYKNGILYVPVRITWKFKDGGSNGYLLFNAWYDYSTNKWKFQ